METHKTGVPISYEESGPRDVNGARDAGARATRGLQETICEIVTRELSKESFSSIARAAFLGEGGRELLGNWDSLVASLNVPRSESKALFGYLQYLRGNLEAAEEVLRSEKRTPWGGYYYVRVLVGLRKLDEASRFLEKSRKKELEVPPLAYAKIEVLCKTGREEKANGLLQQMQTRDGESSEWVFHQGFCQESAGEYRNAIGSYREAVKRDGQNAEAWFRLGYLLDLYGAAEEEAGDEAIRAYESCVGIVPVHTNAVVNLGLLYEDRERYDDAARCYEAVLRAYPGHPRAKLYLADAIAATRMFYDKAQEEEADRRSQNFEIPLTDFELSIRSRNCLENMNVETLGDLVMKTEQELLSFKNFGESSLKEIKALLAEKGLRLQQGLEDQRQNLTGRNPLEATAPPKVLDSPIDDLHLSARSRRCMDFLGVRTVRDLINKTELDLMAAKNFGMTSLTEIKRKLADMGMALRTPENQ